IGHVLRKIAGELECELRTDSAETVGDFDVHQEEQQDRSERIEHRRSIKLVNFVSRYREQAGTGELTKGNDSVSIQVPVPDGRAGSAIFGDHPWIQGEAREADHQQAKANDAKPRMGHALEEPQQGCALQGPAERDPLALELNWENQRDEKERCPAEQRQQSSARLD